MRLWRAISLLGLLACEGPMGPRGFAGEAAPAMDASMLLDGGPPADASGLDANMAVDPPFALRGRVRDLLGALSGGAVVLVPAARVRELAGTPIDLSLSGEALALATNDEPIEDLTSDSALMRAPVAADGTFRFETLPEGEQFVVYQPAVDDTHHLPGGQLARLPQAAEALRGRELELSVSGAPSSAARYVGTSACVGCHARHTVFASGHSLSVRVPGVSAAHQDAKAAPRIDEALAAFASGVLLSFVACSAGECTVRPDLDESAPGVAMRARLGRDVAIPADQTGHYFVALSSPAGPATRYAVALTVGGTRSLQQFVARAVSDGGVRHFVLPFTYRLAGEDAGAAAGDGRWGSFRADDWLPVGNAETALPSPQRSFERECAGCHATGYTLAAAGGGTAVSEPFGAYDLDGDGRKEQLAVGCEACHGPGSEHLERLPRGQAIISPRLITPERQNLICGTCHARQRGRGGELAPLDDAGRMPRAGMARREFVARHLSGYDATATFPSGDPRVHFQQYGDFLRSPKYRNDKLLVTCSDCHDAHRTAGYASDLRHALPSESCAGCHAAQRDVAQHVAATLRFPHDVAVDLARLTCRECHMVRTGLAGARVPALRDATDPDSARHQTYYHGDRSSHRFVFTGRAQAAEQPVAATNGCAPCHAELLPAQ